MFSKDFVREAKRRAEAKMAAVRQQVGRLRERYAKGHFAELDACFGRAGGFLRAIIEDREKLTVSRLLLLLELFGLDLTHFAQRLEGAYRIPRSPRGYLARFEEARDSRLDIEYWSDLETWLSQVEPRKDGDEFRLDTTMILDTAEVDEALALDTAEDLLTCLVRLRPSALDPATFERLVWLLGIIGNFYRKRGSLNTAIHFADRAFELESQLDDLGTRSYLFRNAAYLLCDLGEVLEAVHFAAQAVEIASATPAARGLGESMYVRAVMVRRSGDPSTAKQLYLATVHHLGSARSEFHSSISMAIAYCHLELDEIDEAEAAVARAYSGLPRNRILAKVLAIDAEIQSRRGDWQAAEAKFEEGRALIETFGNAADQAVATLARVRHLLRFGEVERATELVKSAARLANQLEGNTLGEAILLELIREAAGGALRLEKIERAIRAIEEPWRARQVKRSS